MKHQKKKKEKKKRKHHPFLCLVTNSTFSVASPALPLLLIHILLHSTFCHFSLAVHFWHFTGDLRFLHPGKWAPDNGLAGRHNEGMLSSYFCLLFRFYVFLFFFSLPLLFLRCCCCTACSFSLLCVFRVCSDYHVFECVLSGMSVHRYL